MKRLILFAACSTAVLNFGAAAHAQQGAGSEAMSLEEVIVTARRTDERLQNVPVAVTALSGDALANQQVNSLQDLQYMVPALSFSQSVSRNNNRISIRGQGTSYGSPFSAVELSFAEVPVSGGASQPFYDLQSVQVLKGPQGVAFGRNSSGGAIIITPIRPKYTYEAYVSGLVGNFNAREVEGMVNLPLIADKLAVRAGAHIERRDGWTENVLLGTKLDDKHLDSARLSVLFQPTGQFENYTVLAYQYLDVSGSANHMLAYNPAGQVGQFYRPPFYSGPYNPAQEAALALALGRDKIRSDFDGYNNLRTWLVANTSTLRINDRLRVKNIFGYQRLGGEAAGTDMDGIPLSIITLGNNRALGDGPVTRILTNELQVQGELGDDGPRWLAGVFVSQQEPVKGGKPGSSASLEGLTITQTSAPSVTYSNTEQSSKAAFGQVTLPLGFVRDGLSLTAGARHTTDTIKESTLIRQGVAQVCTSDPTCAYINRKGSWKGWNYAITLDYQIDENTLVYAAHRRGFKGGGMNRISAPRALWNVQPEYVKDVEFGVKTDWSLAGMPARTNAAVFNQWYKDIVRTEFVFLAGTAFNINTNIAEAIVRGGELEQTLIIADRLELMAGYSYTEAYFTKAGASPIPFKHFPEVPEHKLNLTAVLDLLKSETAGNVSAVLSGAYQSSRAYDQNAVSTQAFQKGYTLIDGRLNWKNAMGRQGLDASLFVKNATDEEYILAGGDFLNTLGFIQGIYGEPRTFGLEVRYAFGQ